MRLPAALLLPLPVLASAPAPAAGPATGLWPALRAFTSRDGLPQNSAMGMARDREGRLWVATQDGAAVYNGRVWQGLSLPDRQVSNFLRCVAVGPDGLVWFGRQEGGLAAWDGALWRLWSPAQLDGATRVNAVAVQGDTVWVGTEGKGLLGLRAGVVTVRHLPGATIRDLTLLGDGLWIGTGTGLHRLRGGAPEAVALPPDGRAGSLALEPGIGKAPGRLWMASRTGLWVREGARWRAELLPPGWTEASAVAFTRAPSGRRTLWAGSPSRGLAFRPEGGSWCVLDLRAGLPGLCVNGFVPGLETDGTRRLWVGLDEGVARVELGRWSRLTTAHGLPAPSTYGLAVGEDGTLWMGTRNGLWERRGERVSTALPGITVNAVLPWKGEVWAATHAGLAHRTAGGWKPVPLPPAFGSQGFRRLYAFDGDLWTLGANAGIVRHHGGRWETWGTDHGFPVKALHSLLRTEEGLWVGTEGEGLHLWREGTWARFDRASGLPNNTVMDLRELKGPDGRRWLLAATESGGLAYAELGGGSPRFRVLAEDTVPALPNNTVYQVQIDRKGRPYLFTNRGVVRLTWGPGADPGVGVETFTAEDGLPSLEFNGGASCQDAEGRIWAGSVAGPVVFDPAEEVAPGPPPTLIFESLTSGRLSLGPGQVLGHRQARLEASFAAVDLFRGEEMRYRTQLEGAEEEPGPWGPEAHRSFGSLPAGAHTLKVWARDSLGREVGPLAFPFTVKPAPWRTLWAYALYFLAGAGAVAAFVRARLRALERRNAALEAKVAERTKEVASQRDQIAHLMASLAGAQRDVKAWAHGAADDLARSLGSGPIGVFILEGEDLRPLRALEAAPNPSLATLSHPPPGLSVVRVQGPSGVLQGALLMPSGLHLSAVEQGLLDGFASQLGAVLELQRTQDALRAARARGPRAASADGELRLCPLCRRAFAAPETTCPVDGEILDASHHLPHRIQGRYELRSLLGEGGMGLVFEAEDLRLNRAVALKVLRPELYTGQTRARFLQEAQSLAAIQHPGVIAVFDSGEWEGGSAFLVMERLRGWPLASLLKVHGPGHPHQVARLLREGAAALAAAHEAGLLHRDLKPANLFISDAAEPFHTVLLDFGLAKSLAQLTQMTQTGMVIGTPQYMSPEQTRGQDLDARSDLYSFAAVIYEALTGQRLIGAENVGEAFVAISRGGHRPPSEVVPGLDGAVDAALLTALDPDPDRRPLELARWAEALARLLEALPAGGRRWPSPSGPALALSGDLPTQLARPRPGGEGPATQA